jgi:ATP-binding cassette subfamily B protein
VAGSIITLILIDVAMLLTPQILRYGVDRGIGQGDLRALYTSAALLLLVTLFRGVLTYFQMRWIELQSQGVAYDLRNAIHARLASLSFSYHDRAQTGQLLARASQDVERLRFLTGRATLRLVEGAMLLVTTSIVLLIMNAQLGFLALLTLPLLMYRAVSFGKTIRPLSASIQDQLGVLTARLEQNLRGSRIVKAFAQEEAEIARFDAANDRWRELSLRAARVEAVQGPQLILIANIGTVLVIGFGGLLMIREQLTLGELVAFTTYLGQLANPVRMFGMIAPVIGMAIASADRVFEILDARSEVVEAPDAIPLPSIEGHVRFEDVSFSYFGQHRVLEDVTLEACPGEVIALLGTTGSGKSTIINLIPRFYDPTEGRVTVDGYDLRDVTLESLREQIGIVLQETTLFAATIRENIAFGRPDASEEEIVAAAKAAQAHAFITAMPEGYDTPVGERGSTVSGGQKQRIAIARALLMDPRILILDDATSSVDSDTEAQIQAALDRLMEGRTSFVIAQRLSTVRRADLILVMENGRIAARGRHEELLRTSGVYADIYHRQLRSPAAGQPAEAATQPSQNARAVRP